MGTWPPTGGGGATTVPPTVLASTYGADPTGTLDSGPAINAAIAALPVTGGIVYIGPGNFKISTTIQIGDGSQSQVSTRTGVVLVGSGAPAGFYPLLFIPGPGAQAGGTCRLFSGAAVDMLHVNGALSGWGLHNIDFDGASLGLIGLKEVSAQGGESSGCIIRGFVTCGQQTSSLREGSGPYTTKVSPNHMHNRYVNFAYGVPLIGQAIAIKLDGNGVDALTDTSFDTWENITITFGNYPTQVTGALSLFGIYLGGCDSCVFREVEFLNSTPTGGAYIGCLEYDYTGPASKFPNDCVIENVDFDTSAVCIANNGAPDATVSNVVRFIYTENGIPTDPKLVGLRWIPTPAPSTTTTTATVTTPTVTSGVSFTPSATADTMVYLQFAGTGTINSITIGPSTGAENTLVSSAATLTTENPVMSFRVPAAWKMVVTVTTTTITQTKVVTC